MNAALSCKRWLEVGLGFLYPEVCQTCGEEPAGVTEGFVCQPCRQKVRFIKPPFCARCGLPYDGAITAEFTCGNCRDLDLHFRSARSAVASGEFVLEVIHRYKYQAALWFEPFLAALLLSQAGSELAGEQWDLIVPVPLHPAKRRERGFNQAERLAARLGEATRIPLNTNILQRIKPTETQTHLSRQQRAANVQKAFAARPGVKLEGARVVVLDDVFTTGATTSACAKVLRSAGAGDVCVWTVARGL
jgi:competence protein ComFC